MSIEAFKRVYWIVLDGMGIEHVRLFLRSGQFPSLMQIAQQGYLEASEPSSPACQTPTALLALFAGAGPRESGVWGYIMPDPRRPTESVSGFAALTKPIRTIWDELGLRGRTFSLMNVAFRNDPVWSGSSRGLDFGYDGYRLWKKSLVFNLHHGRARINFEGLELDLHRSQNRVLVRKGSRTRAALSPREWQPVFLSAGSRAWACLLDETHVVLAPLTRPLVRGTFRIDAAGDDFVDFTISRAVRALNRDREERERIPLGVEMAPIELGMKQKQELMIQSIRSTPSALVVGYFPLVDELNHACFDLLDAERPDPRTLELFLASARLVDELVARLMAEADRDTLIVLSSDHGVSAFRKTLHLNELLAACGLVVRSRAGYDLRRSLALYHPSDSGLVLVRQGADRTAALSGLRKAVVMAQELGVQIGVEEGRGDDPFRRISLPGFGRIPDCPPPAPRRARSRQVAFRRAAPFVPRANPLDPGRARALEPADRVAWPLSRRDPDGQQVHERLPPQDAGRRMKSHGNNHPGVGFAPEKGAADEGEAPHQGHPSGCGGRLFN